MPKIIKKEKDIYYWTIIDYGTHKCAYIFLPKSHSYYGKSHKEFADLWMFPTYSNTIEKFAEKRDFIEYYKPNYWILGWDWAGLGRDDISISEIEEEMLDNIKKIIKNE